MHRHPLLLALGLLVGCTFAPDKTPEEYFPPTSTTGVDSTTETTGVDSTTETTGVDSTTEADDLMLLCEDPPQGVVGEPYKYEVSASGGVPPYTWKAIALPPGLTLTPNLEDTSRASISGEPTMAGDFAVILQFRDAEGQEIMSECGGVGIFEP